MTCIDFSYGIAAATRLCSHVQGLHHWAVPEAYYKAFFNFIIFLSKRKICSLFRDTNMTIRSSVLTEFILFVCIVFLRSVFMCVHDTCMWNTQLDACCFLSHSLPYCLRKGLSLNLIVTSSARLTDQWLLGICLLLAPTPTPVLWLQTSITWSCIAYGCWDLDSSFPAKSYPHLMSRQHSLNSSFNLSKFFPKCCFF